MDWKIDGRDSSVGCDVNGSLDPYFSEYHPVGGREGNRDRLKGTDLLSVDRLGKHLLRTPSVSTLSPVEQKLQSTVEERTL